AVPLLQDRNPSGRYALPALHLAAGDGGRGKITTGTGRVHGTERNRERSVHAQDTVVDLVSVPAGLARPGRDGRGTGGAEPDRIDCLAGGAAADAEDASGAEQSVRDQRPQRQRYLAVRL